MRHCVTSGAIRVVERILSNSEVNKTHTRTHVHIQCVLKITVPAK